MDIYVILGGACSGKTTVSEMLSKKAGIERIDMDARIYGSYASLYNAQEHPAITEWFSSENPLAFMLGKTDEEFLDHYRKTDAETAGLLMEELRDKKTSCIIEGGFTDPYVLVGHIPKEQIVCIGVDPKLARKLWCSDPERLKMKEMVDAAMPDGGWERFLETDRLLTESLERRCREMGIKIIPKSGTPEQLTDKIADYLGLL